MRKDSEQIARLSAALRAATNDAERSAVLYRFFEDFKNFPLFLRYFFPSRFPLPFAPIHYRLFESVGCVGHDEGVAAAYPRGHAKTTIVGFGLTIWSLLYRSRNALYFGSTSTLAENEVRNIATEMQTNELLASAYGYRFLSDAVSSLELSVRRVDEASRQWVTVPVRLLPVGAGQRIRGANYKNIRPDHILLDDIEDDQSVQTAEQRKKLEDWLLKVVEPLGSPATRYFYIGTILHHHSLLNRIIKGELMKGFWRTMLESAIVSLSDGTETSAWPELWSIEKLMMKREKIGSQAFAQEYMNRVTASEDAIIRAEWIRECTIDGGVVRYHGGEIPISDLRIFMAIDPAISKKQTGDYSALCVVGTHSAGDERKFFVLAATRGKWTKGELIAVVREWDERWNPKVIGVETVAYQQALAEDLKLARLPIKEMRPDVDKVRRLTRHQGLFEFGRIYFAAGLSGTTTELLEFPSGAHDDQVDALTYAITLADTADMGFLFKKNDEGNRFTDRRRRAE